MKTKKQLRIYHLKEKDYSNFSPTFKDSDLPDAWEFIQIILRANIATSKPALIRKYIKAVAYRLEQIKLYGSFSKDGNRISGKIARSLALNSPWIDVIKRSKKIKKK